MGLMHNRLWSIYHPWHSNYVFIYDLGVYFFKWIKKGTISQSKLFSQILTFRFCIKFLNVIFVPDNYGHGAVQSSLSNTVTGILDVMVVTFQYPMNLDVVDSTVHASSLEFTTASSQWIHALAVLSSELYPVLGVHGCISINMFYDHNKL